MILHAVPGFINQKEYGAGNWKAVESSRIALRRAGMLVHEIIIDPKDPLSSLGHALPSASHILVEYSSWPDLLLRLRKDQPGIKVHVRTHNAEAFQHYHRAREGRKRDYMNISLWRKFLQIMWRDTRCRRAADTLLGISEWDDAHYWKFLPGKGRIQYLPYYSPWPYLRPQVDVLPWNSRNQVMVSMGGNFDPSGMANVRCYDGLAKALASFSPDKWNCQLTWWSQWNQKVPKVSRHVEIVRECQEPWDLLCQSRVLAVLTPLGFGFKTTIIDGLAAGCHVIVHPAIAERLPREVRDLCILFNPEEDTDVSHLDQKLSKPPLMHGLNAKLADVNVEIYKSLLT